MIEAAQDAAARLKAAAATYDRAAAADALGEFLRVLDASEETLSGPEATKVMRELRKRRWFDLMERAGDTFIRTGVRDPHVRSEYAQALIDEGHIAAAQAVLLALLDETDDRTGTNLARGLLGRAHKQMYVDAAAPELDRNRQNLQAAADYYLATYSEDPAANHWQGINVVALAVRGSRDGITLAGVPDAKTLATAILSSIEERELAEQAGMWEYASALEASIALGDPASALEWAGAYTKLADPFAVAATKRQVEEVWQITADGEYGPLLGVLGSSMLHGQEGLQANYTAAERSGLADAVDKLDAGGQLERVLGATGVQTLQWYREGLRRSEGVALISDESGRGVGSGFVIRGADLCSKLPAEERFVLTNAHIVADDHVVSGTLYPDEARVSFEALGDSEHHEVKLLWSSPPSRLDTSVLRLSPEAPEQAATMPIAGRLPPREERVYIIGHPLGGGLSFSLQDNLLIDVMTPKLHYRTPTEPGSSGSAVFNEAWKLVAIHHAGGDNILRLTQVEGELDRYAANEGIALESIREQLEQDLDPA